MSGPNSTSYKVGGSLISIVGIGAALSLFTLTPAEESGRKVEATAQKDGSIAIRQISGPEYLKAYLDAAKVPTACDGIIRGVRLGQVYTSAQCTQMLENELVIHAQGVMACTPSLRRPGRDNQIIAAVLFGYNLGVPSWCGSTAARLFNAGDFKGGCDAFLMWDRITVETEIKGRTDGRKLKNGKWSYPLRGLTLRRQRERAICLKGLK